MVTSGLVKWDFFPQKYVNYKHLFYPYTEVKCFWIKVQTKGLSTLQLLGTWAFSVLKLNKNLKVYISILWNFWFYTYWKKKNHKKQEFHFFYKYLLKYIHILTDQKRWGIMNNYIKWDICTKHDWQKQSVIYLFLVIYTWFGNGITL